ncbi:MAG: ABC transporter ATP-binding protein [Candidatus Woesearchaeota archaeon]
MKHSVHHELSNITAEDKNKINEYMEQARSRGDSDTRIHKCLINAGWPRAIIDSLVYGAATVDHDSTIIKCSSLSKRFGDHHILDSISFEIHEGEIFGIIGLSGSGKTTLLNSLIGFTNPEEGEVLFKHSHSREFVSVANKPNEVKRLFGFATQEPSFYTKLTAEENLDHFGSLYSLPSVVRKTNVNLLLELMELSDSRKTLAENLSGGMQRRLGIACSLIHDPKILILDEPTADLDQFLRREMWNLIRKINQQGTTVILSSHFLNEMEELCTRVAILHNRTIVDIGTPLELTSKLTKNDEISLELACNSYERIMKDLARERVHIKSMAMSGRKLVIYSSESEKVLHHLLHLVERHRDRLVDVSVNRPSLAEVFENLVKK